jgi:hypothetical protein
MPAPNAPVVVNSLLDEAYFVSKGFAPDVARAMATGEASPPRGPAPAPVESSGSQPPQKAPAAAPRE